MASSSVAFFSDEQSLKLANLIGELKGEAAEGPFYTESKKVYEAGKYGDLVLRYAKTSEVLLGVQEKDLEPIYNLLIALTKDASTDVTPEVVKNIITPIVNSPADRAQSKLRILSNLYNNLPPTSSLRYEVFLAIINVAAKGDELDVLIPELDENLNRSVNLWGVGLNQERELYLRLSESLESVEGLKPQAYTYRLRYLQTFESADAPTLKTATPVATQAIKDALILPSILNFESLHNLAAVQQVKSTPLFKLLSIFLEGDLKAYREFVKKDGKGVVEKELEGKEEVLVEKIRMLTLAGVAGREVPGEVGYEEIARELEVGEGEVEVWVINVIRAGLIDAKMNQLKKTVVVSRSTHRTFTEREWKSLGEKLGAWKEGLKDVLKVIENAKLIRGDGGEGVVA
ncbi:hypothetical protein HK097_010516 [Rhizophlyctis rosea]|uniref:Eukaryotic translation initiation factor 3 subunit M n=1 Tax=Rhizophlyctis rosea TaxID=64517 RepID=A0AAD5S7G6_9FUNG|nr:hypothetical protein HK097_010516 [Rhizophlyctis rosea]